MAARIVDQDLALPTLNKHHEKGHQGHQNNDEQRYDDAHRTSAHEFEQATDRIRKAGRYTTENQDGNTISQTPLGDLLTEPHQEHGTRGQGHDSSHAKAKARRYHQAGRALQGQRNSHRLEQR